ncbi:MAG: hypothetical protein COT17_06580 [Elusimicrobia bacterium CG08_land_8_20_14_0_20_51_18]|nr:MAG: hypothetical protein COT17_06580 [Elusimicrobia bacterium CG08_land_8_20_14_0_20_51_18]
MKNFLNPATAALLFVLFLFSGLSAERGSGNPLIRPVSVYGEDDRFEYYQADEVTRKLAESTAALFRSKDVSDEGNGLFRIRPATLGGRYNLKAGERFSGQPSASFCSGALVGKNLILTSAHCLRQVPCEKIRVAFDYFVKSEGDYPGALEGRNIYSCAGVEAQNYDRAGADYAIIRLDREVQGRFPLAVNREDDIREGVGLFVIGYPSGMPAKVSDNASVRKVEKDFFVTDLDTFRGNSGSPVFNAETMRIEGVLSRGGTDYVYSSGDGQARDPRYPQIYEPGQAYVTGQNEGRGEDVTKSCVFQGSIPQGEFERALNEAERRGIRPQRQNQAPAVTPAIYIPDEFGGPRVVPAIYNIPEPSAPEVVEI